MTERPTNPYQPPGNIAETGLLAPTEVAFQVDGWLRSHAFDHYLIHCHPYRLLSGSLSLILISGVSLFRSVSYGILAFVPTLLAAMLLSSVVYFSLVRTTRKRTIRRLHETGLSDGNPMTLKLEEDEMTLTHSGQTHRWRNDQTQIHRTGRGVLICPEPYLFVFVPKRSKFQAGSYNQFFKMLKARIPRVSQQASDQHLTTTR